VLSSREPVPSSLEKTLVLIAPPHALTFSRAKGATTDIFQKRALVFVAQSSNG
jgi:hypothetical protein